ncbi:hypothetical protein K438DRAFT_265708 [Mycena galopus ATCC 62051]|nr:hypothetical protein K438DRAFT_265708 [Mycena galopus ATCC 62051]
MLYLKWAITQLRHPTVHHSIGGVTLLQYQNPAFARYKAVTEAPRIPRSKFTNAGHTPGTGVLMVDGATSSTSEPPTSYAPPALDEDVPMTQAEDEPRGRACLGISEGASSITSCINLTKSPMKGVPGRDIMSSTMADAVSRFVVWKNCYGAMAHQDACLSHEHHAAHDGFGSTPSHNQHTRTYLVGKAAALHSRSSYLWFIFGHHYWIDPTLGYQTSRAASKLLPEMPGETVHLGAAV